MLECKECGSRWDKEDLDSEAMECLACGAKVDENNLENE